MRNGTINKMKRPPTERQKTFASNISCSGLVYEIYKELIQLYTKKKKTDLKKI